MKTGTLGKLVLRDPQTIINWTKVEEFRKFFSDSALVDNIQRDFNLDDQSVVLTINELKLKNATVQDIAERLKSGYRCQTPPPGAATSNAISPIEMYAQSLNVMAERDTYKARLELALVEVDDLRQTIEAIQTAWREDKAKSNADLYIQIGILTQKLAAAEEEIKRLRASQNGSENTNS
jgi:hypothetical protein